ncbi:MAG TPA: flagellar basal body L-ring protein FlgH [Porticoccaceae bacterium]|nr:flagellar basal body L-ring protein FlgH [Porticoccaceae bacterium]
MICKKSVKNRIGIVLAGMSLVAVTACTSIPDHSAPGYASTPPAAMTPPPNASGAIYQSGYDLVLFEDLRARRIGDVLRVILVEQTDAEQSSKTEIDKENSNSMANPTLFGKQRTFGSNSFGLDVDSAHEFEGEGESNQSNKLSGSIAVTVANVLPNGNLVVQGEKWIQINQGNEFIRLKGIVRPVDVSSANTVLSTQIADAKISYGGTGALNEANVVGWLARFFMSPLWPF